MRLHHQALIACCCLGLGGCARLLQTFLAPQQAAMSTAQAVGDSATSGARNELTGMGQEVDRLLAGRPANQAELERIRDELEQRLQATNAQDGAAQSDAERLRPWHPRVAKEPIHLGPYQDKNDALLLGLHVPERGVAASGPLPDGTPHAELQTPLNLTPVRVYPRR